MVGFKTKIISNPPTLGERLKNCRQQAGVSLDEISRATKVSVKYLQSIEKGDFSSLPGDVYAKNFLRAYANFLGLNCSEFLSLYKTENKIYSKVNKSSSNNDFKKPVERISKFNLVVTPKIVRGIIVGILALACLVYIGVKIKAIMTPPLLLIESPADNLATEQNFIEIIGKIDPGTTLEINGQQVLADQQGNFSEVIDLQTGINMIEIVATKRHGKQTKVYRQIVVNETEGENN